MRFYLGTHLPNWLGQNRFKGIPLFVSFLRLQKRATFPVSVTKWALDSGGFSELSIRGGWTIPAREYARAVKTIRVEVGRLQWAAIQDWMCEESVLKKTGKTILEHQHLTVQSYLELKNLAPEINWLPVLQGWELKDYLFHMDLYQDYGVDLKSFNLVGIGSVCRRQATKDAEEIIKRVNYEGIRLHGFGFKILGLKNVSDVLYSSDSMAWSFDARRSAPLPGCRTHINCANCHRWAIRWYEKVMENVNETGQRELPFN